MNWYGEVVTNTSSIDWSEIDSAADFNDAARVTGISVTYITNGAYGKQVAASSPWTISRDTVALNTAGAPFTNEFSLKANDSTDLSSAQLVTASPAYIPIDDKSTQTDEHGEKVTTNTLWLKLGSLFIDDAPSGIFYYRITR